MRLTKKMFQVAGIAAIVLFSACSDKVEVNLATKSNLPLEPKQVVPVNTVVNTGTGTVDATYNKDTRTLFYTVKWSNLPGNPTGTSSSFPRGFGLYGPAAEGFNGGLIQAFSGFAASTSGTYNNSVFIDNVIYKEEDVLNGRYYISIPVLATHPAGAVRAQIKF